MKRRLGYVEPSPLPRALLRPIGWRSLALGSFAVGSAHLPRPLPLGGRVLTTEPAQATQAAFAGPAAERGIPPSRRPSAGRPSAGSTAARSETTGSRRGTTRAAKAILPAALVRRAAVASRQDHAGAGNQRAS